MDEVEEQTERLYRAIGGETKSDIISLRRFSQLCLNEHELETITGLGRTAQFPNYQNRSLGQLQKEEGVNAAKLERKRLSLGIEPIRNIFQIVRDQGVRLFRRRIDDSAISGVTVVHPLAGMAILVNSKEDQFRQIFSAAHEYCHVLFDKSGIQAQEFLVSSRYNKRELVEVRANHFAAEFLLPIAAVRSRFSKRRRNISLPELFRQLCLDYQVNNTTCKIQVEKSGILSRDEIDSIAHDSQARLRRSDKKDPDLPTNLSQRQAKRWTRAAEEGLSRYYLELLRRAHSNGEISFSRLAEMIYMTTSQARDFVSELGLAIAE